MTKPLDIYIYDVIGVDFFGEGVSAKQVVKDVHDFSGDVINVYINSPGGIVPDGHAIHNALKRHKATVNVFVDGMALSAASVVMVAGDNVEIADNAMVMIHDPWTGEVGNAADFFATATRLDKVADSIARNYTTRIDKPANEIREMMKAETWLDAHEALEMGLADSITDEKPIENSKYLEAYRNVPQAWLKQLKGESMPKEQTKEPEKNEDVETVEAPQEENENVETPVENSQPEKTETQSEQPNKDEQPQPDPRAECKKFVDAFGDDGGKYFADGLTFEQAQAKHIESLQEQNRQLSAKVSATKSDSEDVALSGGDDSGEKKRGRFSDCIKIK